MSNNVAVDMYQQLGYVVYRRVLEYYSGDPDEDAYGEGFWYFKFCPPKYLTNGALRRYSSVAFICQV